MESFDAGRNQAVSYVFFCYHCGETFARVVSVGRYQGLRLVCPNCPPEGFFWNWLPGSIWLDWDRNFNNSLPDEAVKREFELHLNWAEKESVNEDQSDTHSHQYV